jgi:hypothetical protein
MKKSSLCIKIFSILFKLLKYQILQNNKPAFIEKNLNEFSVLKSTLKLSRDQITKLLYSYDKTVINSQRSSQIRLNSQLLLITKHSNDWLTEMENFSF